MNQQAAKIDLESIERVTWRNREQAESFLGHAMEYLTDGDRKRRHEEQECRFCHYMRSSRVGGAAMTTRPCGLCGKDVMYGSTCTSLLCKPCAKRHSLCVFCGGDVEMASRRTRQEDGRMPGRKAATPPGPAKTGGET